MRWRWFADFIVSPGKKQKAGKENVPCENGFVVQTMFGKLVTKAGVMLTSGEEQNQISMSYICWIKIFLHHHPAVVIIFLNNFLSWIRSGSNNISEELDKCIKKTSALSSSIIFLSIQV